MTEEVSQKDEHHMSVRERTAPGVSVRFASMVTLVAVVGAFGLGTVFGSQHVGAQGLQAAVLKGFAPATPPEDVDLTPLWSAWKTIEERYVPTGVAASGTEPVTNEEKVWGMIQGLAASLGDPYTVFLPPTDAEMFQADISGSFEGVGMEIAIRDQILTVVSPLKDTPAFRAGLMSGDRILEIDGESTIDMRLEEAVQRIRGPRGSEVVFTVVREGENERLEIAVERDVIQIPTIKRGVRNIATGEAAAENDLGSPNDIYVIELSNFSAPSAGLFKDAIQDFAESGKDALILDLRGNPGGYLQAAVEMASWFIPAGQPIVTEDYGSKQQQIIHRSRGYELFEKNMNIVVLVDRGSASASEILAEALRHYEVAQLVGMRTFGKGSVQELVDITPDTALKVTVARWVTPSGESIPDNGIEPDVVVEMTREDVAEGRDLQMERAIEILRDMR